MYWQVWHCVKGQDYYNAVFSGSGFFHLSVYGPLSSPAHTVFHHLHIAKVTHKTNQIPPANLASFQREYGHYVKGKGTALILQMFPEHCVIYNVRERFVVLWECVKMLLPHAGRQWELARVCMLYYYFYADLLFVLYLVT